MFSFLYLFFAFRAEEVVTMLNKMFTLFDERAQKEGIEKIKTIGDAYMAAAGLTLESQNNGAEKMIRFAQGLLKDVYAFNETSPIKLQIRLLRPFNTAKILKLM